MSDGAVSLILRRLAFLLLCMPGLTLVFVQAWIFTRWMHGVALLDDVGFASPGILLIAGIILGRVSTSLAVILYLFWRKTVLTGAFGRFARPVFWTALAGFLVTFAPDWFRP